MTPTELNFPATAQPESKTGVCPKCNGSGIGMIKYIFTGGIEEHPCSNCNGTGTVPAKSYDASPVIEVSEKGGDVKMPVPNPGIDPHTGMTSGSSTLPEPSPEKSLGQIAFEAHYPTHGDRESIWHEDVMLPAFREAWERSAQAVADAAVREYIDSKSIEMVRESMMRQNIDHATACQNESVRLEGKVDGLQKQLSAVEARAVAAEASASLNLEHSIQAVEALKEIRDLCQITGLSFEDQSYRATSIAQKFLRLHNQGKGE